MNMNYYITYPKSIKTNEFCFRINDDDMISEDARKFTKYIKARGFKLKKTKIQSRVKMMGWHVFKITSETRIESFEENIKFAENLVNEYITTKN